MRTLYPASELTAFAAKLLEKSRQEPDKANVVAGILAEGDLLGHSTHGLQLLPAYLAELAHGGMAKTGAPRVIADIPAAVRWDGLRRPGPWLVVRAPRFRGRAGQNQRHLFDRYSSESSHCLPRGLSRARGRSGPDGGADVLRPALGRRRSAWRPPGGLDAQPRCRRPAGGRLPADSASPGVRPGAAARRSRVALPGKATQARRGTLLRHHDGACSLGGKAWRLLPFRGGMIRPKRRMPKRVITCVAGRFSRGDRS